MALRDQSESFAGRTYYKGKGVDWARFLPWLLAAFICAAILAEGMAQLFAVGHYLIVIVPAIAALCVAGMLNLAVNRGHCRSQWVAGLSGFCAGIILYFGFFYLGMIHDFGSDALGHPEALPAYIHLRMMMERTHDVGAPAPDDQGKAPGADPTFMNWGRFGFELLLVLVITTGAALRRSKKTYCEACRRWMTRELTQFEPAQSVELMEALRVQSARSLAALSAGAPFATIPNLTAAVDYCSSLKEGRALGCPAYLSVKNIVAGPKGAAFDPFDQSKGKLLVRALQLNGDEISALAPRFKVFHTITGRVTVNVPPPSPGQDDSTDDNNATYADIAPVPAEYVGKVFTRKNVIVASLFVFGVIIGFLGSLLLMLFGLLTAFPDHPPANGVSPGAKQLGIALIALGGTVFCVAVAFVFIDSSIFGNRYLRNVLRRELGRRTSVLVDPNDPDALFVECVPKLNWGKLMLDNASDAGLMVIDRQRREIRFEGDKERWRIPAASILYCELEVFIQQQGHYRNKMYYVVLRVNHRAGFWEAPIRPRGNLGLFSSKRKKATEELFQSIQFIRGLKPAQDPRVTR
ncbi:MAG TPA: hypothetical protein VGJ73_10250 [Verrucomicrobiae bacterium]|jgi:hypothetical protein